MGCFLPPGFFGSHHPLREPKKKQKKKQNLEELATNNIPKPSTAARNVNSSADSSVSNKSFGELVAE